jgi:multiple sugar transport system ATP-binding protein
VHLPIATALPVGARLTLGVRPEALQPLPPGSLRPGIPASLRRAEDLGRGVAAACGSAGRDARDSRGSATADHAAARESGAIDARLAFGVQPSGTHLFDAGGRRIDLGVPAMVPAC